MASSLAPGLRHGLRRAVRRADLTEALISPVSGAALGLSAVLSAAAYVAGLRGVIAPGAWIAGLVAGVVWVAVAALWAGLLTRRMTPGTARRILLDAFGAEVGRQPDVARPVRAAIETRIRLAEAADSAAPGVRGQVMRFEAAADRLMLALVPMAQGLASQKGGLQFHSGMASAALKRGDGSSPGLARQIAASRALADHAASQTRRLEEGVAGFASLASGLALHLAQGQGQGLADLARQAENLAASLLDLVPFALPAPGDAGRDAGQDIGHDTGQDTGRDAGQIAGQGVGRGE